MNRSVATEQLRRRPLASENAPSTSANDPKGTEHDPKDTVRISVRIPTALYHRLEELRSITHATNVSDVLRNALLFYDALVKERQKGNDVYVIGKEGEKTRYPVFFEL